MRIKVLGSRGEIKSSAPYHSKHSGVLIDGTLLLDIGEKEFLDYEPKVIFITHLHPDHAFFVTEPIAVNIPIYAPEKSQNAINIKIIGSAVQVNSYRLIPVPTHHSKKVKSVAYLVDSVGKKLLYTGDIIWIDKEYHHLFNDLFLVITDGSYIRKDGMVRKDKETGQIYGHTGVPNLINLFKQFTSHILFVHFGNWFYRNVDASRDELDQLGKSNGISLHVGYDGMELDLDELQQ